MCGKIQCKCAKNLNALVYSLREDTVYARKSQNTLKKTNYSSTAVRGASVQCAEKYSVSVRRNEMLEDTVCAKIQCMHASHKIL